MKSAEVKASPEGVPGALSDTSAILAEDLTFAGAAGARVNGYLARPAHSGPTRPSPGLIVIHEAMGLNEHIRDVANRFANIGYVTLAVDLYSREGNAPAAGDMPAIMARLFSMRDETVLGDLQAGVAHLAAREDVTGRLGCIGFCVGGRHTLLLAGSSDRLSAAVDCWGGFIDRATPEALATPERPTPPLELAEQLNCPLLAAIGAEDQNPSPEIGRELSRRALASGQEVKVEVYEGAGHAFFADYRPTYRPAPAARLWDEIVPFLERHLRAGRSAEAA